MSEIPILGMKESTARALGVDVDLTGAMAADGRATGENAKAFGVAANAAGDLFAKLGRLRDEKNFSELRTKQNQVESEMAAFIAKNPDPEDWQPELQKRIATLDGERTKLRFSPDGKAAVENKWQEWSAGVSGSMMARSAAERVQQYRQVGMAEMAGMQAAGNYAGAQEKLGQMHADGLVDAGGYAQAKMKLGEEQRDYELNLAVEKDPVGFLGKDQRPEGVDPLKWHRAKKMAQGLVNQQSRELIDEAEDQIALGKITTPEQMEERYAGRMRPAVLEKLKAGMEARIANETDAKRQAEMATPEYRARVLGEVNMAMNEYHANPTATEYDEQYVKLSGMIAQLPKGSPEREEAERRMDAIRKETYAGERERIKTVHDAGAAMIDDGQKLGVFGKGVVKTKVKAMVDDGFLRDEEKLRAIGYDEQIAKYIRNPKELIEKLTDGAYGKGRENVPGWALNLQEWAKNKKGGAITDADREFLLQQTWQYRGTPKEADGMEMRVAEAIRNYKTGDEIEVVNVAEAQRASVAYGKAKLAYRNWAQLNPNASVDEAEKKARQILGGQVISPQNPKRNAMPQMRPIETSAKASELELKGADGDGWVMFDGGGVKLSNYGYASDLTPDGNSARGIGHANNRLVGEQSAAISKSLADKLGLRSGERLEILTTLGKRVVTYDDTVPSTDGRTGDLPETIDLYRPKGGSNGWGGKVLGVRRM